MKKLRSFAVRIMALVGLGLTLAAPVRAQTFGVSGFSYQLLYSGNGMISIEFDHEGRMLVCEKRGRVLLFEPDGAGGFSAPTVFGSFAVSWDVESGLLGMALDPDYATNHHVYFFYTTVSDQRVVRVTANAGFDAVVAGSEVDVLTGLPRNAPHHKAGDLEFAPGDSQSLYLALGDDGAPNRAQNLDYYEGKLLRFDKATGLGLPTNPFQNGDMSSVRSRIWARGFRNPFRFAFHPALAGSDFLYDSENGNSTDRIAWVKRGTNGNWGAGGDPAFLAPTDADFRMMHSAAPIALGVDIVRGGPFSDLQQPGSDALYWAHLSGATAEIRRWRLTGADLHQLTPISADGGAAFVTGLPGGGARGADLRFGPDGALYLSDCNPFESAGNYYRLARIRFVDGVAPSAGFSTTPALTEGSAPLQVAFSDESSDADGSIVSRLWTFGDGDSSTATNPTHTYQQPGEYTTTLLVTDSQGLTDTDSITVTVTQLANLTLTGQIRDGRNLNAPLVTSATQLRLYQEDGTTPLAFPGGLGANGNAILVPAGGVINASLSVALTGAGIVVSAGEGGSFRPARLGFEAPSSPHTQNLSFYLSGTALRGRVLDTRGVPAHVDLGVTQGSPRAVAGGRDFLPSSGIPSSGVAHRIESDALGYYYVPLTTGSSGAFDIDLVADTGRALHYATGFSATLAPGELEERDVMVGLRNGGRQCAQLAPSGAPIDYAQQIEPIWNNYCTGCHNDVPGQNGSLNLVTDSFAALIDVASSEVPGMELVVPGDALNSYLFEKINCADPQRPTQMRPSGLMPEAQQALIFDWIEQGALEHLPARGGSGGTGSAGASSGSAGAPSAGSGGMSDSAGAPSAGSGGTEDGGAAGSGGGIGEGGRSSAEGGVEGGSGRAGRSGTLAGEAGESSAPASDAGDDDAGCSCRVPVKPHRASADWLVGLAIVLVMRVSASRRARR